MTSSADRINLGELTSQLANAEARVCEWASAAGKRADAARLEHGRRIAALRGVIFFLFRNGFGFNGGPGALAVSSLLALGRLAVIFLLVPEARRNRERERASERE